MSNVFIIPKLLDLSNRVPGTSRAALEKMLIAGVGKPESVVFVSENTEGVNGFIFATVEEFEGERAAFIQFCVVLPLKNEKDLCSELLLRVRRWAKDAGLKEMYFMTRRTPKAFQRKYKFQYHMTVLKRSVDDGRTI